ncbi:GroES-like protein [Gonapodya prolifera JEL478]|uniref:GroES-like protein n=1 Tax=Gonapodya prolifera (strain JEL478) TaxID=1344416 RepID=A0A139AVF6_GONPJ|nr:GroES-like protein [Gonapodya prolifera JEL478]|eukprot:KXS20710.1 GroES-like protein [Gonapodya prolifera JEL478]
MLACTWWGKNDVRMTQEPIPAVTDPKDAVIRVTGSTVCGSDLHLLHGEIMDLERGFVLGHEAMGRIDELGEALSNGEYKIGDRVVICFPISCGSCRFCKEMLTTACDTTNASPIMKKLYGQTTSGIFGYSHFVGGFGGCQAEYVRVPFADFNLLKVPDTVPDEKALFLSDIVATSYHAVFDTGCKQGETIGVWGLGPIGLEVCQWLQRTFRAARIVGIDKVPARLKFAHEKFGVDVYNFEELEKERGADAVVTTILEKYPGGLDRCIDCAGFRYRKSWTHTIQAAIGLETDQPEVLNECIRAVRKFGSIGVIADYAGTTNGLLIGGVMEKGIRLIGCGQAPVQKYWKELMKKIETGEHDPTVLLTHRLPFEKCADAYYAMDQKQEGMIKTFLQTKFSSPRAEGTPELTDEVPKGGAFA